MADNVDITPGSGATIAADEISLVKFQRVKLTLGADGVNDGDVASGNPLPAVLTAGSAAIGKLAANSGVDIGDVDVLSLPAPLGAAGASSIAKAEDAASATADVGVPAMAIRKATPANTSDTDGDYEMLQMSAGRLWASATIDTALPAGTNNIGKVDDGTTAASTMNASSSDGATALTSTAQAIKGSAGTLMGYYIYNPNATAVFVQFYNTAQGSVTVGTTNPLFMLTIPAGSAANLWMQPSGISFGTAISWSATSTAGGNGAPTTALDAIAWYK